MRSLTRGEQRAALARLAIRVEAARAPPLSELELGAWMRGGSPCPFSSLSPSTTSPDEKT